MSVDVTIHAKDCCDAHNHQFTYNYTPALREAGFPSWKMLDRLACHIVDLFVQRVMCELQEDPNRYGALIRGGGEWGTITTLLEQLQALGKSLAIHPHGFVRCS